MTAQSLEPVVHSHENEWESRPCRCPITGRTLSAGEGVKESRGWDSRLNRPAWVIVAPEVADNE